MAWTSKTIEFISDKFAEYALNLVATSIVLLVGYIRRQGETILRVQKTSVVLLNKNNIQCGIEIYYFHIIKCTQLTKCTLLL